jgi:quinol monooxygenase YgiN
MILATAHFHVQEGHADEFVEAATTAIAATTSEEPGCLAYSCYRDVLDDLHFVFVEEWEDMPAIGAHVQAAHYQAFNEVAARVVGEQEVTLHTVEKSRKV